MPTGTAVVTDMFSNIMWPLEIKLSYHNITEDALNGIFVAEYVLIFNEGQCIQIIPFNEYIDGY